MWLSFALPAAVRSAGEVEGEDPAAPSDLSVWLAAAEQHYRSSAGGSAAGGAAGGAGDSAAAKDE
jgi:hypothetical protein